MLQNTVRRSDHGSGMDGIIRGVQKMRNSYQHYSQKTDTEDITQ